MSLLSPLRGLEAQFKVPTRQPVALIRDQKLREPIEKQFFHLY